MRENEFERGRDWPKKNMGKKGEIWRYKGERRRRKEAKSNN